MNQCIFPLLLWLLLGSFSFFLNVQSVTASMWVSDETPAAFEQLEAPRPTFITLYYGGNLLGSFHAHLTPSHVKFDEPDSIIALIPTISDKSKLQTILGNFMPRMNELLCGKKHTEHCGTLSPDVAGIIFNENSLSAELFINSHYLLINDDNAMRYLPIPPQHFSSVYAFGGAMTGTQSQLPTYAFTNDSIFAYGENKLSTQSTLSNTGIRFDTMEASSERNGWQTAGGLFRSQQMQLLSDTDMAGVSFSTSMRTVLDSHKNEGNDVIVYLPRRAFVSIYRDGRLYSSRAYEAGNQHIDTTDLPEGAYTITLKIQEYDGSVREEKRFYAKNQALPPPDFPSYYMEAGVLRKIASEDSTLPSLTSYPLLGAGTTRRLDDNIGLGIHLLGLQDRVAMETGIFCFYHTAQMRLTALSSTHGDYGLQASYEQTNESFSTSVDIRKTWEDTPTPASENIISALSQATAIASYTFNPNITLGLRASYSETQEASATTSVGPYLSWHIWQQGESMLEFSADAAHINGHDEGSMLLHFSYKLNNYGITGGAGALYGNGANGPTGNIRLWHNDETADNTLLSGAGITADKNTQILSADGDWRNHSGMVRGSIQEAFGNNGPAFGYGGNFAINAAQIEDEVHVGGEQNNHSAVVIDTEGDADATMQVLVNNLPTSTVKIGRQQVIYLTPYHSYTINLANTNDVLLDFDENAKPVTLYPGNVVRLKWKVKHFYIMTGRVVNSRKQPLVNALLKESRAEVSTNESGYFQAELSDHKILTFMLANEAVCEVKLPEGIMPVNGVIIYHEPLICVPH